MMHLTLYYHYKQIIKPIIHIRLKKKTNSNPLSLDRSAALNCWNAPLNKPNFEIIYSIFI